MVIESTGLVTVPGEPDTMLYLVRRRMVPDVGLITQLPLNDHRFRRTLPRQLGGS